MSKMKLFRNIENIVGIPLPKLYRDINLIVNKNESTYEDINNIVINHQSNIIKFLQNKDLVKDKLYISNYISKIIKNDLAPIEDIICITDPFEANIIRLISNGKIPCVVGEKGYYYRDTKLIRDIRCHLNELKEINADFENSEVIDDEEIKLNESEIKILRYVTNDKITFRVIQDTVFEDGKYNILGKMFWLENRKSSKNICECMNNFVNKIKNDIENNKTYVEPLSINKVLTKFEDK